MLILCFVLIAALVACDQLIKLYIVRNFAECRGAVVSYRTFSIGDFDVFSLTHIRNNGAGWSILGGQTVFLTVFTVIVLAAVFVYMFVRRKKIGKAEYISLCLISAGGIGNLIDRVRMLVEGTDVFRGVIDYIKLDFIDYPVFNFADCCVVVGAILFCIMMLFGEAKTSKAKKAAKKAEEENEQV